MLVRCSVDLGRDAWRCFLLDLPFCVLGLRMYLSLRRGTYCRLLGGDLQLLLSRHRNVRHKAAHENARQQAAVALLQPHQRALLRRRQGA